MRGWRLWHEKRGRQREGLPGIEIEERSEGGWKGRAARVLRERKGREGKVRCRVGRKMGKQKEEMVFGGQARRGKPG